MYCQGSQEEQGKILSGIAYWPDIGLEIRTRETVNIQETTADELIGPLNEVEAKNAPRRLFFAGDESLLATGRRVSVVGSRKISEAGAKRTMALVKQLVQRDYVVVSGLAEGVDTVAHETAIELGGKTVAVLGTGLDKAYPASNADLLEKIVAEHVAVSQFAAGSPPARKNFPMRNRTMALLTNATVIIEAGEKSGTRHQGWEALRLGRALFIMESVANDESLTWPREMISYGATVLSRENLDVVLENIPRFTRRVELAL